MLPSASVPAPQAPNRVQLPRSSTRLEKHQAYLRIVTEIRPQSWGGVAFEGTIYAPGAVIDVGALPRPAVAIECAGPVGAWQRGKHRELLYILWRFDVTRWEWIEIARTQALSWDWQLVFRDPAWRALHPRPDLVDVIKRSRDVGDELLATIDRRLESEGGDVRASVLSWVYEQVAGRIAGCA